MKSDEIITEKDEQNNPPPITAHHLHFVREWLWSIDAVPNV